jgi:ATP-binding cassette subfamily B (MDR/TAP) protein 1
MMFGAMAAG